MNDTTTATVRTAVNGTILSGLIVAVAAMFGWTLEVADLAPFLPVIGGALAIFYRLSRWVSARWPAAGWVLFGVRATPSYPAPVVPPLL